MYELSKLRPYNVLEFEFPFCKHELCLVPSPPPAGCDSVSAILCSAAASSSSSRHQGLPLLYLDLSDCPRVSDAGLQVIARNAPRLQHLYLRKCVGITGKWRRDRCFGMLRKALRVGIYAMYQDCLSRVRARGHPDILLILNLIVATFAH